MIELLNTIRQVRYGISRPEILNGTLKKFVNQGLRKATFCDYGSRRSCEAAQMAVEHHQIPVVFIIGGLSGILDNMRNPQYPSLIKELRIVPEISVILWTKEVARYEPILRSLPYIHYETVDHFSDNL